jgi:DNA-binding HxlR family transcriptional regulator
MQTQTLRNMEASGLIKRNLHPTVPPGVDYSLTALGERFVEPIEMLYDWDRRDADALRSHSTSRRKLPRPL